MADCHVLVTGGDGQVARALRAFLPGATYRSKRELDVTDETTVHGAVAGMELVVHTAAMTQVDACEARPDEARAVNDAGTRHVVAAARSAGARVVLLSTDYVFDGVDPPYSEDDGRAPLNVYGRTKAGAEDHLDPGRDLVVRTSWVFGDGHNFVRTILRAAETTTPRVVDDQIGRPTAAHALARALAFLADRPGVTGHLHVAGDGAPCSWADLADAALTTAGSDVRVARVDSESYAAGSRSPVAPRPTDATLSLERARSLGVPLVDWRTSLDGFVKGIT